LAPNEAFEAANAYLAISPAGGVYEEQ